MIDSKIEEMKLNHMNLSPLLIQRYMKCSFEHAQKLCNEIALKNHLEARQMAKEFDD